MANTKITADGLGVTVWWALPNAFANPARPTLAEMNSNAVNVTDSVAWENYSFGASASTQNSDPSMGDVGNVQSRGFAQFGGTISFFYPKDYLDSSNEHLITFLALEKPLTVGYVIIRVDGKKTTGGTGDSQKGAVALDFLRIYKVISDGWSDVNTGEADFKYSITFQPQGDLWVNAVVAPVSVAAIVPIGPAVYSVATQGRGTPLAAYITGRQLSSITNQWSGYPGQFNWSSSDPSKGSVDQNGVFHPVAAGSTTVTATHKATGLASTGLAITVTA